jgi:flagellin-like protein
MGATTVLQSAKHAERAGLRVGPSRRWNRRRSRRGVSDVVATILLLALTVTLFSSIFFFVTSFPPPPPQNTSQFSANLVLTANQSYVAGVQITHLAGPAVNVFGTLVYFKSARFPSAPEFASPLPASAGLGAAVTWNLGQTFNYTFPCPTLPTCEQPILPDNITVLVTAPNILLFSTVLPGQVINTPPTFLSTSVSPAKPVPSGAFTIIAVAAGNLGVGTSVYVNLANIQGLSLAFPTAVKMTYNAGTNQWTYPVAAGYSTVNGTYFAFVNVTNTKGQSATAAVAVQIAGAAAPTIILSVAVGLSTIPSMGSTTTFVAYITYTGAASAAALNVSFYANRTTGTAGSYTAFVGAGPAGTTISGPSTLSVFSTTRWSVPTLPGTQVFTIKAVVTVAGVGDAVGLYTYTLPLGLGPGTFSAATSHTCTLATTCPLIISAIWLNGTAFFGSGPFTFSASIFLNYTTNGTTAKSWSTSAGTLTASPATLTAGTLSTLTPTTRWKPAVAGLHVTVTVVAYVVGVGLVECVGITTATST